jgi:hypothetical protein
MTPSTYSRSNYKAGPFFSMPLISEASELSYTPQRHVSWPDQPAVHSFQDPWMTLSYLTPRQPVITSALTPQAKLTDQSNILIGIATPKLISSFQEVIQGAYKDNVISLLMSYQSGASGMVSTIS